MEEKTMTAGAAPHEESLTATRSDSPEATDTDLLIGALFEAREQLRLSRLREEAMGARVTIAEKQTWVAVREHRRMTAEIDKIERSRFFRIASIGSDTLKKLRRVRESVASLFGRPSAPPAPAAPPPPDREEIREILSADFPNDTCRELANRFSHFRHEGNPHYFRALVTHLQAGKDDPLLPTYFEFAISCNQRGEKVAELLGRHTRIVGKRYLDIGCAYGGFLVAFAHRGAEATGVDLDESLLELARANFRDQRIDAQILLRDVTREGDLAGLGPFDLITANDVLEHVEDPAGTIRHIARLLAPGGAAYLEIPNGEFPAFVRADGHFGLFGITLLDNAEAHRYYATQFPGRPYGVGHYLALDDYVTMLERGGLRAEVLETEDGDDAALALETGRKIRQDLPQLLATVPESLREAVGGKVQEYLDRLTHSPRRGWNAHRAFLRRYGTSFWRILAHKPGEGRG
jgi:2-polyprenyl-3-methyl-5-hydroxy-6-metoxy-1,4-benzoquinol methylase